jgi:hypothetical protein
MHKKNLLGYFKRDDVEKLFLCFKLASLEKI